MADVKEFYDLKYADITTPKRVTKFRVEKDKSGYAHFIFRVDNGSVPRELEGKYTSISKAVRAFEAYENTIKDSKAARGKELEEFRRARRVKSDPKSK